MDIKIGISGMGFVGNAMMMSFIKKGFILKDNLFIYDKYKDGGIGKFEDLLKSDILFLALPTTFNLGTKAFDISAIEENLFKLKENNFDGLVVIKSTVEPLTINNLNKIYNLDIVHNPEFLTARNAFEDFHNQKHIVLGMGDNCNKKKFKGLYKFYKRNYSNSIISKCNSIESESMKLFLNNFYAIKVQVFTEIYLLCDKLGLDYNRIRDLMLKNEWINPMHTNVPGPDGKISYGGLCFPKDTNALCNYMEKYESPCEVLKSTIIERNNLRNENKEKN